jgi:cation-transporting ATPase 13A1
VINVDPSEPLDADILRNYDLCLTGAAVKQYASSPLWLDLVQHTWVYARVSPAQKEFILATLKDLGYTTLMAGDGTNDVGALKRAHIGVALLNGSPELLKSIAEKQNLERLKKMYDTQLRTSQRFKLPPPVVPKPLHPMYPELVAAQAAAAKSYNAQRSQGVMSKVRKSMCSGLPGSCVSAVRSRGPASQDERGCRRRRPACAQAR